MSAIVMNTLTGAVSEYTGFDFHAITLTHAGSALGLYALGGDLDLTAPIVAAFQCGESQLGDAKQKRLDGAYFDFTDGSGDAVLHVDGREAAYTYDFTIRTKGVSRAPIGKGIRENYLAFGFSKPDGLAFTIGGMNVLSAQSKTRRI